MTDHDLENNEQASDAPASVETKRAGRGLISIAGAKIFFILTSYAVQLSLPRLLETPEMFGLYSAAMSGVSILNNVLIASTIQSVSKFVSEDESRGPKVIRDALKIQLVIGGALAMILFTAAPMLAEFLLDDALTPLLRVASLVVFSYSLYAVFVGSLNGRRLFQKQAMLDVTFSTLRTGGILTGAALGFGALGALSGFSGAAVCIALAAAAFVGFGKAGRALPLKTWFAFMAPIWLYQGFLNGVLQLDVQILKKTIAELAMMDGAAMTDAAGLASEHVGFYRAAQTFAFVPYQLILSMTFIVFPMISRATSDGDLESARSTIRAAMRFSLLVLLAIAAPISGSADGVLRIAYPEAYLVGAPALSILVLGMVFFALFVIAATVLSSAGKPSHAAVIALIALIVVVIANRVLITRAGVLNFEALPMAALATTLGTIVAFALAGGAVFFRFRALFGILTLARASIAAVVAYFIAQNVPHDSRILAIGALAAGFFGFLGVLVITREVTGRDLAAVKQIIGR